MSGQASRRIAPARRSLRLAGFVVVAFVGCSPDVKDGLGPQVPIPNVEGSVLRATSPASGLKVSLRTRTGEEIARTATSRSGGYGFANVEPGSWEVKVSGQESGDFESVARMFELAAPTLILPTLNIYAYGAAATDPGDGASSPVPKSSQPLVFRWVLPSLPGVTARVQVFDATASPVWYSPSAQTAEVPWDGLGNQGSYAGVRATPGNYSWRVKFELPDSSQAKVATRSLVLR